MATVADEQEHVVQISEVAFIAVRPLAEHEIRSTDTPAERIVQLHTAVGNSGIMLRLAPDATVELIAALAAAGNIEAISDICASMGVEL